MAAAVAGLRVPSSLVEHASLPAFRVLMGTAFVVSAGALMLAALVLVADSGRIEALGHLFLSPRLGYLSIGAWSIAAGIALCVFLAFLWRTGTALLNVFLVRILHVAAALVGLTIAMYTGLFLSEMRSVPLWNTIWLPALFVLSSISCGATLFMLITHVLGASTTFPEYVVRLARTDAVVVALEAVCAFGLLATLLLQPFVGATSAAGAASASLLISGECAWVWWAGFVTLGLIVPLCLDVSLLISGIEFQRRLVLVAPLGLCVSVGAFALRACVIMAGLHPALSFF